MSFQTKRAIALFGVIALVVGAKCTFAVESSTALATSPHSFETPIGLGSEVKDSAGAKDYALVFEGQNHFKQRPGAYGLTQYGQGQARLEAGSEVGIALTATSGVTLLGLGARNSRVSPHIGIEPMSGRILWSSSHQKNYYEWLPMASLGLQFSSGSCRVLPLLRGGAAGGTITKAGILPEFGYSYGAGSYLNCATLDLAAEVLRVVNSGNQADVAVVDFAHSLGFNHLKLGLRGEQEFQHGPNANPAGEQRLFVVLRTQITD